MVKMRSARRLVQTAKVPQLTKFTEFVLIGRKCCQRLTEEDVKAPTSEVKPVAPPRKSNRAQEDLQPIGLFTRRTLDVWKSVLGSTLKVTSDVQVIHELFRRMDIYPTQAQVHEMLELSRETRRHSEPSFSYGAFTFYAAEMKYSERKMKCNPRRKLSCGSPCLLRKPCRLTPQASYDVFLGGSCNPTQWRRDEAIPALKGAQVTFYNPQREDWLPDLINLEQQAKDDAKVLLFVLDKETRSLASMVEIGERSALKKQTMVLAIEEISDQVMGEKFSERELKEMRRGRNYMRDIAEVCGIRVFSQIRDAVQSCIDIVKGNYTKDDQKHFPKIDKTLGEKFIKLRSTIDNYSTHNKLSKEERNLAFRGLHGRDLPKEIQLDEKPLITDAEFCMINSEFRNSSKLPVYYGLLPWRTSSDRLPAMHKKVFICGPVGDYDWKAEIAYPYFRENHVMTRERNDPDAEHLMPMEMEQIANSSVLLFVFPSDTWGSAEMIMASYYIALGKKVVLCTQQLSENTLVYGQRLTSYQAKDYNRCKMYLNDQACRNGVPIMDNIRDAVAKAAEIARK